MATAGEKFFEDLTNGELSFMARTTGIRLEDWEDEVSGVNVNSVVTIVASRRAGKPLGQAQLDNMTPKATAAKLEELLGALGYEDDPEDADAEDLVVSENTSPKPQPKTKQSSASVQE